MASTYRTSHVIACFGLGNNSFGSSIATRCTRCRFIYLLPRALRIVTQLCRIERIGKFGSEPSG